MKKTRKFPRPSPALIVAIFALVMATTGTGFAAKAALISGSQIKPHSITSKQLAKGAVDHAALAPKAVKKNNFGSQVPLDVTPQICPDGSVTYGGTPCAKATYKGLLGSYSSSYVTIPAAAGGPIAFFGHPTGDGPIATTTPQWQITPDHDITISHLSMDVDINSPSPGKLPDIVIVGVYVNGQAVGSAFCTVSNPIADNGGNNTCQEDPDAAPVVIPANSRLAFIFNVFAGGADPTWAEFQAGVTYVSSMA